MHRALSLLIVVALAASGLGATVALVEATPAAAALPEPVRDIPLDPVILDPEPLIGGGVEGHTIPSVSSQNWRVHAFAQIGDRIFRFAGQRPEPAGDENYPPAAHDLWPAKSSSSSVPRNGRLRYSSS